MSDEVMIEPVHETEDWKAEMLGMAKRAHTALLFGERRVCIYFFRAGDMPALGLYRLKNPSTLEPWGIENVECCQAALIFKTREALDIVRGWLGALDDHFDVKEVAAPGAGDANAVVDRS